MAFWFVTLIRIHMHARSSPVFREIRHPTGLGNLGKISDFQPKNDGLATLIWYVRQPATALLEWTKPIIPPIIKDQVQFGAAKPTQKPSNIMSN